jgi:hypothetical protein
MASKSFFLEVCGMSTRTFSLLFVFSVFAIVSVGAGAEQFTYVDLIRQLTDLERLAVLPADGEKCQQWSSYDRASKYDAAAEKYVAWDANDDGPGIIRKEGDVEVFAEIEGPAVIWRIWSAKDGPGHVKIYLDGAETPAVDLPFSAYFDCSTEPFTRPALVHKVAQGLNNYTPIPFQKSCKIVAEKNWGRYYHFTYTTYPKGTQLPTFSMKLTDEEARALDRANAILTRCGSEPAMGRGILGGILPGSRSLQVSSSAAVEPGQKVEVARFEGRKAITNLRVKVRLPERPQDVDVLRELTIAMYWDGENTPSVWAPLGDFFGTAAGENLYKSLPLGMTEDGYYCNWYMPFADGAVIEIGNDGEEAREVDVEVSVEPLKRPIEQLGRFHAKWHRDMDLDAGRPIDWTMLKTQGRGRFCGVMLHVWNPRGSWWGEGDEKFFIDGEKFPSTFGTGSEDYFGYAWCNPTLFQNCYHNQTISMNNKGHISVNRWHIGDNVPFAKSFEGAIEKYYLNNRPTLYACTSYWYLDKDGVDHYRPVGIDQRKGYWGPIQVFVVKGAMEGEKLKVLKKTGGNLTTQDMTGFGEAWSNEAQLWWTGAKPGDVVELALPVAEAGGYKVKMQLTKAIDYGIVRISLDGIDVAGRSFDLFNRGVIATGELDMGTFELAKGEHTLRLEIVGANPNAVKSYMVGLDYVKLEKQ